MAEEALGVSAEAIDPVLAEAAGATTSSVKTVLAVSMVASWSSSFEPKWAKSPLLLVYSFSLRRPIVLIRESEAPP